MCVFWDMEDERRCWRVRPLVRLVSRAARWRMQHPVLDGPFTETKEVGVGRRREAG
jgi:hypothetical protein